MAKFKAVQIYPEIWGGVECTINRRNDNYMDQLHLANHYERPGDLEAFAALGIKAIRYPILWEKHCINRNDVINWNWSSQQLTKIRKLGIEPIAGLLHHGSGPIFTSLMDDDFPTQLAEYAKKVADQFPWIKYFTPVNEPLTTARFAGLYGLWYPHHKNEHDFLTMLLNQVEGIVLSMKAIREINPVAKLVQTEDIGKTHSTPLLKYQANFENSRRWLTYDLLCGAVTPGHRLWTYFLDNGIKKERLKFFIENPCFPHIAGFNYYVTSERYLDEKLDKFPSCLWGTNGRHDYADSPAVRYVKPAGIKSLLTEAWNRYHLPMAITEAHLNCTREEQLRWFKEMWDNCCRLIKKGIDIKSVTAWSLLGAYDWDSLLVHAAGHYETGVFDITNNSRRPTAMANLIRSLSEGRKYNHPLLSTRGWWHRNNPETKASLPLLYQRSMKPLLIIGKMGRLGNAFKVICEQRGIHFKIMSRQDIDITSGESIKNVLDIFKPWAVINTTGYVKLDNAETETAECFIVNSTAPGLLAKECKKHSIPFMTFSTDMVFDGDKRSPYMETDEVFPINMYGKSKAEGEATVIAEYPQALVIRTSAFFGPWDKYNFVYDVIRSLEQGKSYSVVKDVIISPTYIPDLVNSALDLFIDEAAGIWHISNKGNLTWAEFAQEIANRAGHAKNKIIMKSSEEMEWKARRPLYSVLESEKGLKLPFLHNAVDRYFIDKAV